jgi:thiamine biosynthesis protein ThiS
MKIKLNGESLTLADGTDLLGLLALQGVATELVAIELNETMIPRAQRAGVTLKEGDVVELLKMIAGGQA